ncbi:MAG: ABC transporter ATP-binding protein [Dehalococcoidia bacterium]|jgi:tungstate transport system ATP-binding protein
MAFLKLIKLEQRAGDKPLLKNINLDIEKGELFVIIGPTGAGKTTLLRLIDLLDRPYSGEIQIEGLNITDTHVDTINTRRRMAIVFQKPVVFNGTVFENIAYPLKMRGIKGREIEPRVGRLLDTVGLGGYGRRKARTLSGGEAQRVALARAVIADPELLLLDEPTANLDPLSVKLIEELVIEFNKSKNVTVVMATHDMQQGRRLASRAGVLMQGELVQVGSPEAIFQSPDSARVAGFVGMQNVYRGRIVASDNGLASAQIDRSVIDVVSELEVGKAVDIFVRPEDIVLSLSGSTSSARNNLKGVITAIHITGPLSMVIVDCGIVLEVLVTIKSVEEMGLRMGLNIFCSFKASAVKVLPVK